MNKLKSRIEILKKIDDFIRANVQDEEILVSDWFAYGVPDCADYETLEFVAFTDDGYIEFLERFVRFISAYVDQLMEEDL